MDTPQQILSDFLNEFPLESLSMMTLDRYTNLERDNSFCYWLESKASCLGSIWGGSSFKFGIYRYASRPDDKQVVSDDKYAWYAHYGKNNADDVFSLIRDAIVQIANAAVCGDLDAIEEVKTFGDSLKWKIAFLYSNWNLTPIYKKEYLQEAAAFKGMENVEKASIADMQRYLQKDRGEEPVLEYMKPISEYMGWKLSDNDSAPNKRRRCWVCAPGEQAEAWEEMYEDGEIGIGWDDLGDLRQYKNIGDITNRYKAVYAKDKKMVKVPHMLWKFTHAMRPGDIVIARNGMSQVVGWGIVESPYFFRDDDGCAWLKSRHKVRWMMKGNKPLGKGMNFTQYTLVDQSNNPQKEKYLMELLGITTENGKLREKKDHKTATIPEDLKPYIDRLRENGNIVLTGAPGTGKTYLAGRIAEAMGATKENSRCQMVQFHPSYDYTDFVEGLRPTKDAAGTLGFERRDGEFKAFCKKALKNIEEHNKKPQQLAAEKTLEEKYNEVIELIENGELNAFSLKTEGKVMEVVKVSDNNNIVLRTPGTTTERTYTVSLDRLKKVANIYPDAGALNAIGNINEAIRNAIGGCNSSSYWAVLNEVYKHGKDIKVEVGDKVEIMDYVFIIDEINRGDLSKIFGELFFCIDPGYRGEKGKVRTQYQNMIEPGELFADGFFVPENVYVIGTMNDIDRSVESMDFAMRRRFGWMEVKPEDRIGMWGDAPWKDEARERMHALNDAIKETRELGSAYQIGPAYFLKLDQYKGDFGKLWEMHIKPLLAEYLRGVKGADEKLTMFHQKFNLQTNVANVTAE